MAEVKNTRANLKYLARLSSTNLLHDTAVLRCIRSIHNGGGTSRSSLNYTRPRSQPIEKDKTLTGRSSYPF